MQKLAITGGPSAGKTTLCQAVLKQYATQVAVVPEAASILFGGGWPRRKTIDGIRHQQKAIYFLQRELEALISHENPHRLVVCDRGSLDGLAYWPNAADSDEFLRAINSSLNQELGRYDWLIHLDTAPESYYDVSNPLRRESFDEAWALNERIKTAWSTHPQRFVITNSVGPHFIDKMHRALVVIREVMAGRSFAEIQAILAQVK